MYMYFRVTMYIITQSIMRWKSERFPPAVDEGAPAEPVCLVTCPFCGHLKKNRIIHLIFWNSIGVLLNSKWRLVFSYSHILRYMLECYPLHLPFCTARCRPWTASSQARTRPRSGCRRHYRRSSWDSQISSDARRLRLFGFWINEIPIYNLHPIFWISFMWLSKLTDLIKTGFLYCVFIHTW